MKKTLALVAAAFLAATGLALAQAPARDAKKAAAPAAAPAKKSEPIDINRASKKDLMTLSGIGEARADAIIKARPFRAKNEIVDKKIVPPSVYNDIKDKIVARQ